MVRLSNSENSVLIGAKPFMNYVSEVVALFANESISEVVIMARGKFICKAVDVAEIAKKRLSEKEIKVKDIKIDSDDFESKEKKKLTVSTIEIFLG